MTWPRPESYANGQKMRDLGGFTISRAEEGKPVEKIGDIQVYDEGRFQVQRTFTFIDGATVAGKTYHYQVTSSTTDGYVSEPSNDVTIVRKGPSAPGSTRKISWCPRQYRFDNTGCERNRGERPFIRQAAL